MLRSAIVATSIAVMSLPALAATDDELAQKCVSGMKTMNPRSGAQVTYQPGGTTSGFIPRMGGHDVLRGTWTVENGKVKWQGQDESGSISRGVFSIRMDDAGKCYFKVGDREQPVVK